MKHSHFRLSRAAKTALTLVVLSAFSGNALADKINLNTADAETLQYIPGIGQSRAEQLIQAREQAGGFSSMDQVDAIPGFGDATMKDILKYGSIDSGVGELTDEMRQNPPARPSASRQTVAVDDEGSS